MKRLAVSVTFMLLASRAEAANEACFNAALKGQELRNAAKLVSARRELIECAKPSCPREVAQECTRWLGEVNEALPTAVFGLRDAAGSDVQNVHVFVDGEPAGTTSDGMPVPIDPGSHSVRFVKDDGSAVEKTFVARAGEKNRSVIAQVEPPRTPAAPPPEKGRTVPVGTIILGGVAVVSLGIFGFFGATGVSARADRGCDVGCKSSDKRDVDSKFLVADVGLVVGAAALVGAALFYLLQPSPPRASAYFDRERRIWK